MFHRLKKYMNSNLVLASLHVYKLFIIDKDTNAEQIGFILLEEQ